MAEIEPVIPAPAEAPGAVVTPEPVVPAQAPEPVVAPVVEPVTPEPIKTETVPEAKPEATPELKPHTETATLLEGAGKTDEKPGEVKPEDKPGDKPLVTAATNYEFKLPETLKADAEKMGEYTSVLGKNGIAPEVGQQLIDLHAGAMQRYADHLLSEQHRIFADTRKTWVKEVMADAELGGAGHQTAMGAVARMRDMLVPEADRKSFDEFLRVTGAGDHPAFLRLLHTAARFFDEPAMPSQTGSPPPNNGKNPGGRRAALYDHPTSGRNRN